MKKQIKRIIDCDAAPFDGDLWDWGCYWLGSDWRGYPAALLAP